MYLTPHSRLALLMHEGTQSNMGKTGLSMLRYSQSDIVAVIDYQAAGQSLAALTGIAKDIPIVESVSAALAHQPDTVAIGIAPSGESCPNPGLPKLSWR